MTDVEPLRGELVSDDDYLERLASRVREESRNLKVTMTETVESMFIIGECLNEARKALASNEAYGAWFAAQGFGFTSQWGRVLRAGALNESLVRPALQSQLSNGNTSVNFEQTVKRVVGTGKPASAKKPTVDYKALAALLAQVLRDLDGLVNEQGADAIADALAQYDEAVSA